MRTERITAWLLSATLIAALLQLPARAQIANVPIPAAPTVNAKSYIVIDADTGYVVASQEPDRRVEPASLTKLMSAYVIFQYLRAEQIQLAEKTTVSRKSYKTPGSRMFIEQNSKVTIDELIQGMIVQSGNDATVALAEHVAGTEEAFAELMNNFAAKLGMASSHFENSTGLPGVNHYSTARDMAILARAIIAEFPDYYAWYSQRDFTYGGIRQQNRNRLLWRDSTVDGMKTGYTEAAGYCLVSSAKRSGMRLIAAMMGSTSAKARIDASQALLNYGFRFYETRRLYASGEPVREVRAWKGAVEALPLGPRDDLFVTVPRGRFDALEAVVELPATIFAPIDEGQSLGELVVKHGDESHRENDAGRAVADCRGLVLAARQRRDRTLVRMMNDNGDETLLEFPAEYPIKIVGRHASGFERLVLGLIEPHTGPVAERFLKKTRSRNGRFVSLTVTITATSKAQLDAIYSALSADPNVLFSL